MHDFRNHSSQPFLCTYLRSVVHPVSPRPIISPAHQLVHGLVIWVRGRLLFKAKFFFRFQPWLMIWAGLSYLKAMISIGCIVFGLLFSARRSLIICLHEGDLLFFQWQLPFGQISSKPRPCFSVISSFVWRPSAINWHSIINFCL